MRFLEFFAANIRNPHTRRAYTRAAEEFLAWCASAGVPSIAAVQPVHVATWIEADDARAGRADRQATARGAAPSVRLAGHRPGRAGQPGRTRCAGPAHVVTSGQTPVLDPAEARALLDSIDVVDAVPACATAR